MIKANEKIMVYIGSGKYRVGILDIVGKSHYLKDETSGSTYGPYFDIEIEAYNEDEINARRQVETSNAF